ncbi:MAG: DNA topoisomerase IB [Xanthobacteraceae bacterium]
MFNLALTQASARGMFRQEKTQDHPEKAADITAALAKEGLRYVSDTSRGYKRKRTGTSFTYHDRNGKRITDPNVVKRIKAIGIPPAYDSVWICPAPNGHIQATGLDARGRKQYRYHPKWRELRDQTKYERILQFAAKLPTLRRRIATDMRREALPRQKVMATVACLLDRTLIRVGNSEYAATNKSFGLTTLRRRHVAIENDALRFEFTGKSGKRWNLLISDKRIISVVKRCAEIPGHDLFKYINDDGSVCTISSGDVNGYIKAAMEDDFTTKDFRTWAGTVLAASALAKCDIESTPARMKRNVTAAIGAVARQLGNTPAICRKCYVHPEILDAYATGDLVRIFSRQPGARFKRRYTRLSINEIRVLAFLEKRLTPAR